MSMNELAGALLVAIILSGPAPASAQLATALTGSNWSIVEVYGEPLPQDEMPFIAFDTAGGFDGCTACNFFYGSYSAGDETIVLLTRLTTLRGCVIENKRRSGATLEALDSSASFAVLGSVLTLADDTGEPVVRLEKQAGEATRAP